MRQPCRIDAQLVAHVCDKSRTRVVNISHTCARTFLYGRADSFIKTCRLIDKEEERD
jgi:hypothetical protein